jgi:hypothetical protein
MRRQETRGARHAAALAAGGALVGAVANRLATRWEHHQASADPLDDNLSRPDIGPPAASLKPAREVAELATAEDYFLESLAWLGVAYRGMPFWTERDVVYVLQQQLTDGLQRQATTWRVFNGHRVNPGESPPMSADLVIVAPSGEVTVGAEFKYEPCHRRTDIAKGKFPVAVWTDVIKDTVRAQLMVERGAEVAYAICVDEGGWTKRRDRSMFEEHLEWDNECPCGRDHPTDVLIHRASVDTDRLT